MRVSGSKRMLTLNGIGSLKISIRAPGDRKLTVTIDKSSTVLQLKQLISEQEAFKEDPCPPETQRLIYSGRVLKDDDSLTTYKIVDNNVVHLVRSAKKPDRKSPTVSIQCKLNYYLKAPPPAAQVPQNINTGQQFAGNPLSPLMNSDLVTRAGGLAGLNPFANMGVNQNDPNFLQNMMTSPEMRQQMDSIMSNPEVIDEMIRASPELRALGPQARQIMQSPMFRQMITSPEMMQQAMAMRGLGQPAQGPQPGLFGLAQQQQQQAGAATTAANAPGSTAAANPFGDMFAGMNPAMFGQQAAGQQGQAGQQQMPNMANLAAMFGAGSPFGGGGFNAPPPPSDGRSPEERFEVCRRELMRKKLSILQSQLTSLRDMGFVNTQQNVRALMATGGHVEAAIEYSVYLFVSVNGRLTSIQFSQVEDCHDLVISMQYRPSANDYLVTIQTRISAHTEIREPRTKASRRRLELIMLKTELIPGICAVRR